MLHYSLVCFLYPYEADFLQWRLKKKDRKLAQTFYSSFRYIEDVLSLNNSRFCYYLHFIYPNELEVQDTTDTEKYASHFNIHIAFDNGGRLKTKRDEFTFPMVNFLCMEFTIHSSHAILVRVTSTMIFCTKPAYC